MPSGNYFIINVIKLDLDGNDFSSHFEVHNSDGYVEGPYSSFNAALDYVNNMQALLDAAELDSKNRNSNTPGPSSSPHER